MAKPRKVEESPGTYSAAPKRTGKARAPSGKPEVRYVDEATAARLADKIFAERKSLLHKLAQ